MIDCHVHTWRCRHASGTADEYVRAAAGRGIRTIAFTEHLPLAPALRDAVPGADSYAMPYAEMPEYVAEVEAAARLGESLGVEVLLGCEADAVAGAFEHAREIIARYPFDVVLGSVHFIGDWAFDDPDRTARYADWDNDALWERYFADLTAAVEEGIADVIAHADLVKKFRRYPAKDPQPVYARLARALARAGVAVEVNTAGLRKPCAEIYPGPALLEELFLAGVPATIGSDAHRPREVGADADLAVGALRAAGYTSVRVFRGRLAQEVALDDL